MTADRRRHTGGRRDAGGEVTRPRAARPRVALAQVVSVVSPRVGGAHVGSAGGQVGSAGLLTLLVGVLVAVVGGGVVAVGTDLGVAAARGRTAADAAALAAIAASPLVGGDNDPLAAAAELTQANGAMLSAVSAAGKGAGDGMGHDPGDGPRDGDGGGWPVRVEVRVGVEPATALARALLPRVSMRAAAEVRPPPPGFPPTVSPESPPPGAGRSGSGVGGLTVTGDQRLAAGLLANPRLTLSPAARRDIAGGRVDPRVLAALATLVRGHTIGVSVIRTGHSRYVAGTRRVSNHYHARAVDISMVDGRPVGPGNDGARAAVAEVAAALHPDELGSPFAQLSGRIPGHFSDAAHRDHLHLGWRG